MTEDASKELVRRQFGAHAAAYATSRVHAKGASLARLVELVRPQSTWRALDIATAAGHTAFAFAPHVHHVVATDLTPQMLDVARGLAQEKGLANVSFEPADAEHLPFAEAQFDLVTCRIAPHHFPHVVRFLAQCRRVLRPQGVLAVVDNVVPADEAAARFINDFERLRDPSHVRALSLAEWLLAFQQAGFTVLHQETAPKAMEFESWAARLGASEEIIARLRNLLLEAPPVARAYFVPETQDGQLMFTLSEAIIVGRSDAS